VTTSAASALSALCRTLAAGVEMLVGRAKQEARNARTGLPQELNTSTTDRRCRNAGAL
jgi:hypothetical protein